MMLVLNSLSDNDNDNDFISHSIKKNGFSVTITINVIDVKTKAM